MLVNNSKTTATHRKVQYYIWITAPKFHLREAQEKLSDIKAKRDHLRQLMILSYFFVQIQCMFIQYIHIYKAFNTVIHTGFNCLFLKKHLLVL